MTRSSLPPMRARPSLAAALTAAALSLAACGGSDDSSVSAGRSAPDVSPAQATGGAGMHHIHGLGVRGGTLFIATHEGLWVAPEGQTTARRLGRSRQDIMGFSVVA